VPKVTAEPRSNLNDRAVRAAEQVVNRAVEDLLGRSSGPRGIVISAPAGAGKSHLIADTVGRARERGRRVAVAAQTNEQAFGLVWKIAELYCAPGRGRTVSFVPASDVELPVAISALPGVQVRRPASQARGDGLIVGTLSKLGDAFGRGDLDTFDLLLVDESFQADSSKYFAVGALAPVHLLVGDGGQISPFTTIEDPARWRGLPEDPLQTAVGVLRRNHPSTPVYGLPISRRLDPRAVGLLRVFYPELSFDAAVRPGVRELCLDGTAHADRLANKLDAALDLAAQSGWAHIELPRAAVLQADPEAVELIVRLVRRLLERSPRVRCERHRDFVGLPAHRLAVGVSHNDQKDLLQVALAAQGLGGVVVETANKLQGLEFDVVVAWHPLAGLPEPDGFHLDPGRLCVLLTRHRHACVVVGRAGDEEMLEDQPPPPTPAYLGWDPDPILDGWEVHRQVFAALELHRVDA
jgi:AAA domain